MNNIMENNQIEQNELAEWEAEEFEIQPRNLSWYAIRGGLLLLVAAYLVYIKNWILLATVLMLGMVFFLAGRLKPRILHCSISKSGVAVGDKTFGYDQLKTFWFSNVKGATKLHLISTFKLMPVISLRTNNIDLESKIRAILSQFLPESKGRGEDLIDKVNRFLKL